MDGVRSVGRAADSLRSRAGGSARGSFALPPEQTDASRAADEIAPAEVSGLFLLQEDQLPEQRNRAARRRCDQLLRALGELQLGLLAAGVDPELVPRLASLAAELPQAADPTLAALARMVSLRAKIEVARRGNRT